MSTTRDEMLDELRQLESRAELLRRRLTNLGDDDSSVMTVELVDQPSRLAVYDLVIEHLSEAIIMIADTGKILEANKTARELFGLRRRRYGLTGIEAALGETLDCSQPDWFKRLQADVAWAFAVDLPTQQGCISAEVLVVYVEQAEQPLACVLIKDVTARKHAQEERSVARRRLDAVLAAIPDVVYRIDHDGVVRDLVSQDDQLLTHEPSQLLGKTIRDVFPPPVANQLQQKISTTLDSQAVQQLNYRLLTQAGDHEHFEAWLTPLGERDVIMLVRHLRLARELDRLRDDLVGRLEEKNQELQQFTYRISHDLKNPLVSIKGFAQLMADDLAEKHYEELDDHASEIMSAAEKMQWLIDQILDLSRVGAATVELESLDMNQVVEFALKQMAGLLQAKKVRVDVEPNLPKTLGDFHQLATVFQNLIDNACKYAGEVETIQIEIGARTQDDQVAWFVRDNGAGIDPSHHRRVFELFQRLDRHTKGSGVGLALVKRIVEVHGGEIWIESSGNGDGTTFWFSLDRDNDWSALENS